MKRITVLGGVGLAAATASVAATAAIASTHATAPASKPAHTETLTIAIRDAGHGTESVSPSGGNLAIAPGVPVRVVVVNYTHEFHTFTVRGLHVSKLIRPATAGAPTRTTFTFTAWEGGSFAWYCVFCAHDGPGHRHSMHGTVYAIIDPSALP